MENILTKYTADEVEEAKGKIKRIEVRKKEYRLLKEKLEEHFNFEITDYIIDDILDYETYYHTCLMINLAVINNRISIDNGEILKAGLRIIFKIKNEYDRFKHQSLPYSYQTISKRFCQKRLWSHPKCCFHGGLHARTIHGYILCH